MRTAADGQQATLAAGRRIHLLAALLAALYVAATLVGWIAVARGGDAGLHFWRSPGGARGFTIRHVMLGSPAEAAGVRAGDVLVAVNGLPARDDPAFLSAFYALRAGDQATFLVLRRSAATQPAEIVLSLRSRLETPETRLELIILSVVGLLTLAVPLVVALARPLDRAARLLLLAGASFTVLLTLAIWSGAYYTAWLELGYYYSFVLACAALLHFFLAFPAPHPFLVRLQASPAWLPRRLGRAAILLYVVPLALTFALFALPFVNAGWAWLVGALLLIAAIGAIVRSYRQPPTPLARAQLKWIFWSLLLVVVAIFVVLIPPLVTDGEVILASPSVAAAALGLFPVALGVAVLRYRLFDVNAVLRATLIYPALAIVLVAIYLAGALLARRLVTFVAGPAAADGLLDEALAALVVAALAHGTRERLQALLDRLVYRERLARRRLLEEASETLSRPLPPDAVTAFLTGHAARALELTAAWLVPASEAAAKAAGLEVPAPPAPAEPLLAALEGAGLPMVLASRDELLPAASRLLAADRPGLAAWHAAGARVLVPLRAAQAGAGSTHRAAGQGELLGVWVLGGRESGELFDHDDLNALARIGGQAAVLLDYARLNRERLQQEVIQNELARAREIQERLLPAQLPGWPGQLELAARFRPARQMSGDFYDVFPLRSPAADRADSPPPDRVPLQIAVGDVAGKSIPAALVMALARTILRAVAQRGLETAAQQVAVAVGASGGGSPLGSASSPATTLRLTGAVLHSDIGRRDFVCCALAVVEPRDEAGAAPRLRLVNAAQVPPILCRDGRAAELEPPGDRLPLGVLADPQYEDLVLDLQPGDVVVFATDGLPEAPAQPGAVSRHQPSASDPPVTTTPNSSLITLRGAQAGSSADEPWNAHHSSLVVGEMFGFERLAASAAYWTTRGADADAVAAGLWADLTAWCGEEPSHDDMTLVVLRVPPASDPRWPTHNTVTCAPKQAQ